MATFHKGDISQWRNALSHHNKKLLAIQVLKKFRIIYGSVRQHFREIEQTCGVTGSQLWIMQEISATAGIGISELAENLAIHQSTCSLLVDKLVVRKLVIKERSKQDQRRVGLRLTVEAVKLLKKSPGPAEGILPEALRALPAGTIKSLDSSLAKVIEQLEIKDEKLAERPLSEL